MNSSEFQSLLGVDQNRSLAIVDVAFVKTVIMNCILLAIAPKNTQSLDLVLSRPYNQQRTLPPRARRAEDTSEEARNHGVRRHNHAPKTAGRDG